MTPITEEERDGFDRAVQSVIGRLPSDLTEMLREVAVLVEDEATPELVRDTDPPIPDKDVPFVCGLHVGIPYTEASVEDHGHPPPTIYLFRRGVIEAAGGAVASRESLSEQIRITLLHEIGHQFGLDEDDLAELGYD